MKQSRSDRAVEVRIEAVRAAVAVAQPHDDIGNLLIHADWLRQFLENGEVPIVESSVIAERIVAVNKV
jgi:hypothetical protein